MAASAISLWSPLGVVMFTTLISGSATSVRHSPVAREAERDGGFLGNLLASVGKAVQLRFEGKVEHHAAVV